MISFQVNDMTCGHCVNTITKAVMAVDKDATVQVELAAHRVDIEASGAAAAALANAIKDAGYTPVAMEGGAVSTAPAAPAKRGGCCCN